jgi:pyridinium-3,5-bisthiocarboxylic acid mononucleotide nickel chelatase
MKKTGVAYFDCFSGISGDMALGALVDAGADLRAIETELRKLRLDGWSISAEKVKRGAILATHVKVEAKETHHPRGLAAILKMIEGAGWAPRAAERAAAIFEKLAKAEAQVHGVPVEQVHFHEVGAIDSIIDIVGAAIGFELMGIDEFACSSLDVGGGHVRTAHGVLPVPAPATAELLRAAGAPTHSSGVQRELVTPTGAAIATTLAASYAEMPEMTLRAVGYGAGSADFSEKPNVLRLMIGEREATARAGDREAGDWDAPVTVIETNVDDMSPQIYGYFVDKALEAGALDVFSTPVQMKKNRPGLLVTLLSDASSVTRLIDLIFRETTTIGVRTYQAQRRVLDRELVHVTTPFGEVRMKVSRMNGTVVNAAPEYEDCQRIAAAQGIPLKQVIAAASAEFEKQREMGGAAAGDTIDERPGAYGASAGAAAGRSK